MGYVYIVKCQHYNCLPWWKSIQMLSWFHHLNTINGGPRVGQGSQLCPP